MVVYLMVAVDALRITMSIAVKQLADDLRRAAGGSDFELKVSDCVSANEFVLVPKPMFMPRQNDLDHVLNSIMLPKEQADALIKALEVPISMPSIVPYTEAYPVKHSLYSRFKNIAVKFISSMKFLSK